MTDGTEPEVKDVERVEVTPSNDDETIDPPEGEDTPPESSQDKKPEGDEPPADIDTPPDTEPENIPPAPPAAAPIQKVEIDGIKRLPDETDREYAQRLEITRLRGKLRGERVQDILGDTPPAAPKKEQRPENAAILKAYKPEQIEELKKLFGVLADDMGFVKKSEMETQTFIQKGEDELQSFLGAHPEYLPENDPQGLAWGRFKQEYGLYKPPTNPKDFKKLFEKVHRDIYGVQPKGDLGKITAQKEKIKVASHSGAPSSPAARNSDRPTTKQRASGLRTDMLKGFSQEEIDAFTAE